MVVRMALLGAGRIGKVHARAVDRDPGAELACVTDTYAAAAEAISGQYGCNVQTIEEIATADDIDAVIICTPTNTHADLIEKFARAGKAIFCEKPVDLNLGRVRTCLQVIEETGVPLMLGFNRRFDPDFVALRDAINAGKIGTVEQVNITSRDPGLPPFEYIAASGGIFRDMTVHDFDMARFLLGEEVTTVQATGSVLIDPKVAEYDDFDTASVILTTGSGRQCVISNSRRATYGYDQRIEVLGSTGMICAENHRPVSVEIANADGFTRPPLHDFFMTRYIDAYAAEIASFVSTVTDNRPASPSGVDGLMALAMAEAALKSVAQERAVAMSDFI